MSVIFAQRVGGDNMVLVEPSSDFWPNIRMSWEQNGLADPTFCFEGFIGAANDFNDTPRRGEWPKSSIGPECGNMAYRHPNNHADIPTMTIDKLVRLSGRPPTGITVDIEGAEFRAVRGAEHTLRTYRPLLWLSVHPFLMERDFGPDHPGDLHRLLGAWGYRAEFLRCDHEYHMLFRSK
jgi:FkbM family methyltransferase